jgi:hypothetical protein
MDGQYEWYGDQAGQGMDENWAADDFGDEPDVTGPGADGPTLPEQSGNAQPAPQETPGFGGEPDVPRRAWRDGRWRRRRPRRRNG